MYRFGSESEARQQLEILKRHFIPSRQQIINDDSPSLHLWIKGYEVTEEDNAQGIIGHFAVISYRQVEGSYTLHAIRIPTDAKLHPQRGQVARDNPNWGHPVMRAIRKGKTYPSVESAQEELGLLHRQFPKVSIPNPGKLYIMIYCSSRPAKQRMVKHVLEIKPLEDGNYLIYCKENKPKNKVKPPKRTDAATPAAGYFTAKVKLSRRRRQKSSDNHA
jgi:hypothetical protein